MMRNICMVTQSIVVLLLILSSSALLLAHDEKYMYGNPVNSGTVINLILSTTIDWVTIHIFLVMG
jgi:hypothetical protein